MVFWNHIASLKGEAIFYSFLGRRDEKNPNAYYNFWMNLFWSCAKSKFANGFYMILQKKSRFRLVVPVPKWYGPYNLVCLH